MPLFMLRLNPDPARAAQWMAAEGLLNPRDDGGYGWHALLAAAFGAQAPAPFRVIERSGRPPYLLAYSTVPPEDLRTHAALYADPTVTAALHLDALDAKPMPQTFPVGQRLGFEVRVRPVVRRVIQPRTESTRSRSRERDAFLDAIEGKDKDEAVDRESVYRAWLAQHLETGGAILEQGRALGIRRCHVVRRSRDRKQTGVEGPDSVFAGTLRVADPEGFAAMLTRGVGRHRAFGFGMLLLRPASAMTARQAG